MYAKFNGRYVEFFSKTAKEDYDEIKNISESDLMFLIKDESGIHVNETAKIKYYKELDAITEIVELKAELIKVKEDIEQVDLFGMVRDDIVEKRARAAWLVNRIREIEGKEPRLTS